MKNVTRVCIAALVLALTAPAAKSEEQKKLFGTLAGKVIATGGTLLMFDGGGETVWSHPGGNRADIWMLPNGNLLMGIYQIQKVPNGAGVLEITREKKLVWRYIDTDKKSNGALMGVQLLDAEGKPLPGDVLR